MKTPSKTSPKEGVEVAYVQMVKHILANAAMVVYKRKE